LSEKIINKILFKEITYTILREGLRIIDESLGRYLETTKKEGKKPDEEPPTDRTG